MNHEASLSPSGRRVLGKNLTFFERRASTARRREHRIGKMFDLTFDSGRRVLARESRPFIRAARAAGAGRERCGRRASSEPRRQAAARTSIHSGRWSAPSPPTTGSGDVSRTYCEARWSRRPTAARKSCGSDHVIAALRVRRIKSALPNGAAAQSVSEDVAVQSLVLARSSSAS